MPTKQRQSQRQTVIVHIGDKGRKTRSARRRAPTKSQAPSVMIQQVIPPIPLSSQPPQADFARQFMSALSTLGEGIASRAGQFLRPAVTLNNPNVAREAEVLATSQGRVSHFNPVAVAPPPAVVPPVPLTTAPDTSAIATAEAISAGPSATSSSAPAKPHAPMKSEEENYASAIATKQAGKEEASYVMTPADLAKREERKKKREQPAGRYMGPPMDWKENREIQDAFKASRSAMASSGKKESELYGPPIIGPGGHVHRPFIGDPSLLPTAFIAPGSHLSEIASRQPPSMSSQEAIKRHGPPIGTTPLIPLTALGPPPSSSVSFMSPPPTRGGPSPLTPTIRIVPPLPVSPTLQIIRPV